MVTTRGPYPWLNLSFIAEVSVPSQKSIWSCICVLKISNKRQRILKKQPKSGQSRETDKTDTQDDEKQTKNTTQYVLDTTICKQTQITQARHEHSQTTGGKDEPNIICMRKS